MRKWCVVGGCMHDWGGLAQLSHFVSKSPIQNFCRKKRWKGDAFLGVFPLQRPPPKFLSTPQPPLLPFYPLTLLPVDSACACPRLYKCCCPPFWHSSPPSYNNPPPSRIPTTTTKNLINIQQNGPHQTGKILSITVHHDTLQQYFLSWLSHNSLKCLSLLTRCL